MIERRVASEVAALLDQVPAVALLGPRPGAERYRLAPSVWAIGLAELCEQA